MKRPFAARPLDVTRARGELARLRRAFAMSRRAGDAATGRALGQAARLRVIAELSRRVAEARPDSRAVLEAVSTTLSERLGDGCAIRVGASPRADLHAVSHVDPEAAALARALVSAEPLGARVHASLDHVTTSGEPIFLRTPTPEAIARVIPERFQPYVARFGLRSLLVVPLRAGDRTHGIVALWRDRSTGAYRDDDLHLTQAAAEVAALALEHARLHESERLARAAEEAAHVFLSELLAAAPVGMALLDTEGHFIRVNPALAALNGVAPEDHAGRHLLEVLPDFPEDATAMVARVMTRGEPLINQEIATRTPGSRGQPIHGLCTLYPIRSTTGAPLGFGLVVADLSAQKKAYEEARAAIGQRDQVLSVVSHDLKSPLTTIRLQRDHLARQLAASGLASDGVQRSLDRIGAAASTMTTMLVELVDAARLQAGQDLTLERQRVDLVALTRVVADDFQQASPSHRIQVTSPAPSIVGFWDPDRLERVVTNLLSNAVKYSPAGGPIDVSLDEARRDDGGAEVILAVRDQGLGIPEHDLPHVFDWFRRAGNVQGRIQGTGLGLPGARRILEQHGGSIAVESREGQGSTFTVRLPLDDAS